MSKDIDEMEKMLNDYLQFAKTQTQENTTTININNLINSIKNNLNSNKFVFENNGEDIELKGGPIALKDPSKI